MGNAVVILTKFVMFCINISRFFKGKLGDETETEVMQAVEEMITNFFGGI